MNVDTELSVKGFCFRGFAENTVVAEMVKAIGLDRIDLSGCQVSWKDPASHRPAIEAFGRHGVHIVGIGCVQLSGEPDDIEYFNFCREAGCDTISLSGNPATFLPALHQAQRWAEEYNIRLAIHNHGGNHWLGNSQMLSHVLAQCNERVGLCLDTAWCIQAGENPIEWLKHFRHRIYAVHFKDFRFDPKGNVEDVIVGEGALDLPAFVKGLSDQNFTGPAIVEYEGDVDNPVPALKTCVQRMRQVFQNLNR